MISGWLKKCGIPSGVREAFRKAKREFGGRGLLISDMMEMLGIALASFPRVFVCIDALDEYLPKHPPELLELLRDIVQGSPRTRIFLTRRPHIGGTIQRYFAETVVIPISPSTDDIRNYLEMRLNGVGGLRRWTTICGWILFKLFWTRCLICA